MLPRNHPDRIRIAFDDHRLVANAGLLLPATLALRLGLSELADRYLDLGNAPGRANTGDKLMTLVASALADGDCIDDADALRAGSTGRVLGCKVKAPSTLGTFLRSFRWGHVRQLDRVSRELLARAWAAGAGPGDGPLIIDIWFSPILKRPAWYLCGHFLTYSGLGETSHRNTRRTNCRNYSRLASQLHPPRPCQLRRFAVEVQHSLELFPIPFGTEP